MSRSDDLAHGNAYIVKQYEAMSLALEHYADFCVGEGTKSNKLEKSEQYFSDVYRECVLAKTTEELDHHHARLTRLFSTLDAQEKLRDTPQKLEPDKEHALRELIELEGLAYQMGSDAEKNEKLADNNRALEHFKTLERVLGKDKAKELEKAFSNMVNLEGSTDIESQRRNFFNQVHQLSSNLTQGNPERDQKFIRESLLTSLKGRLDKVYEHQKNQVSSNKDSLDKQKSEMYWLAAGAGLIAAATTLTIVAPYLVMPGVIVGGAVAAWNGAKLYDDVKDFFDHSKGKREQNQSITRQLDQIDQKNKFVGNDAEYRLNEASSISEQPSYGESLNKDSEKEKLFNADRGMSMAGLVLAGLALASMFVFPPLGAAIAVASVACIAAPLVKKGIEYNREAKNEFKTHEELETEAHELEEEIIEAHREGAEQLIGEAPTLHLSDSDLFHDLELDQTESLKTALPNIEREDIKKGASNSESLMEQALEKREASASPEPEDDESDDEGAPHP